MALSRASHGPYVSANAHGSGSYVTSSFTPAANSLLVVFVHVVVDFGNSDPVADIATPSGGGWTYTSQVSQGTASSWSQGARVWTAPIGSSPASMTLTLDCASRNIYRYTVCVYTETGYDTGTPVGGTAAASLGVSDGAGSITLSAAPATTSEVIALTGSAHNTATGVLEGSDFTELYDAGSGRDVQTQVRTGSTSTTVGWQDVAVGGTNHYNSYGLALEIKAAAAAGTVIPVWLYQYRQRRA